MDSNHRTGKQRTSALVTPHKLPRRIADRFEPILRQVEPPLGSTEAAIAAYAAFKAELLEALLDELDKVNALRVNDRRKQEIDNLTKVANLSAFVRARAQADRSSDIAVILVDLDNFGLANKDERYGWQGGSAVLKLIADCLVKSAKRHGSNRVFRIGGDEFIILASVEVADQIIEMAEALWFEQLNQSGPIIDDHHEYPREPLRQMGIGLTAVWGETFDACETLLLTKKRFRKHIIPGTTVPPST